MSNSNDNSGILAGLIGSKKEQYVAFVDLLGFGDRVVADWTAAARSYESFVRFASDLRRTSHRSTTMPTTLAHVQYWSDAAVVIGDDLPAVAESCQDIQTGALLAGVLVRGGISKGFHARVERGGSAFVVSDALVRAAKLEKQAHYPRILVDRGIGIHHEGLELMRSGNSYLMQAEDGECMVVPFVPDWTKRDPAEMFAAYDRRLEELVRSCSPQHLPKYEWMRAQLDRVIEHFYDAQAMDPTNDPA